MEKMTILVTGGTVFASRYTAEFFAAKGHQVYVLNRGSGVQSAGVTHIRADRAALGSVLKPLHFDAVLDVTAYHRRDTENLLDALGSFGTYILISSSAVYPETLPQPFREDQPTGANTIWGAYGTDKIEAEKCVMSRLSDYYILRPPYLYGPMNNLYREAFLFECAEMALPFYMPKDGTMPLQFFHIRDLCRFMEILLTQKPEQRIFNVGNPETVNIRQWAEMCYRVLGKTPEIQSVDGSVPQRSYFPFYDYAYMLDVTAQTALMPDTVPLFEGLCESYAWYKENRDAVRKKPLLDYIRQNLA